MRGADDSIDVSCDGDDVGRWLADGRDGEVEGWGGGSAVFDVVNGRLGNRNSGKEHRETFCSGVYDHPCRFCRPELG
jgi:hypothetical protein